MICKVNGKISHTEYGTVGALSSEFALDSMMFDTVVFDFNEDYKGVTFDTNRQPSVFTYSKSVCGADRDIASPIIMVTSPFNFDVHVLANNYISTIKPSGKGKMISTHAVGSFLIQITLPGTTETSITEYSIRIPSSINLQRKVVWIKKFDIYLTGCSQDHLQEVRSQRMFIPKTIEDTSSAIRISIKGNIPHRKRVSYCFNGIISETFIEKSDGDHGMISVTIGSTNVLTKPVTTKQLLHFETSIMCSWEDYGGINLIVDDNFERLIRAWNRVSDVNGAIGQEAFDQISQLMNEKAKLEQKVADLDNEIEIMNLKLQQEEHKTIREQVKTQGTMHDQRMAGLMEAIKLTGAVLGAVSLIVTMVNKMNPGDKKLIEWSIPMLKRSVNKSINNAAQHKGVLIGIGTTAVVVGSAVLFYRKLSQL